jgi:hypothetical protein
MTTRAHLSATVADTSPDTLLTGGCQRQLTPTYGTGPADRFPLTGQGRVAPTASRPGKASRSRIARPSMCGHAAREQVTTMARTSCAHVVPTRPVVAGQSTDEGFVIPGSGMAGLQARVVRVHASIGVQLQAGGNA